MGSGIFVVAILAGVVCWQGCASLLLRQCCFCWFVCVFFVAVVGVVVCSLLVLLFVRCCCCCCRRRRCCCCCCRCCCCGIVVVVLMVFFIVLIDACYCSMISPLPHTEYVDTTSEATNAPQPDPSWWKKRLELRLTRADSSL